MTFKEVIDKLVEDGHTRDSALAIVNKAYGKGKYTEEHWEIVHRGDGLFAIRRK